MKITNKKNIGFVLLVTVMLLSCTLVFAQQKSYQGEDTAAEIGRSVKDSVQALIADNSESMSVHSSSDIMGTVMGVGISKAYFNFRASLYQACGSEDAAADAWDCMKLEVYERNFAMQHELLPTEAEITAFTEDMRMTAESTEESHAVAQAIITSMGLTEDEYWEEFKPRYETPVQLIKSNVGNYFAENDLHVIDVSQIECEILDQDYYDSFHSVE